MKYKHTLWGVGLSLLFSLGILSASAASPAGEETVAKEAFAVGKGTFLLNGKPCGKGSGSALSAYSGTLLGTAYSFL